MNDNDKMHAMANLLTKGLKDVSQIAFFTAATLNANAAKISASAWTRIGKKLEEMADKCVEIENAA